MSEYKKEIATAVGVAIVLAVLIGGVAIYFFPGRISGSFGGLGNGGQFHAVYPTVLSCSIQNGSCEITIRNQETYSAEAIGCLFQNIYAVNGNNQSLTTINVGTGVLSTQPKGPPLTTTFAVNSTATVYCTPSASVPIPTVGSQADGEVQFTNQSVTVQFLGTWQK